MSGGVEVGRAIHSVAPLWCYDAGGIEMLFYNRCTGRSWKGGTINE